MEVWDYPGIDIGATGRNISSYCKECGYSVKDLQGFFGFERPQAIYNWMQGRHLPSLDHLYAMSLLFGCDIAEILVLQSFRIRITTNRRMLDLADSVQCGNKAVLMTCVRNGTLRMC